MDERYFFYYEDVDLCYSFKKVLDKSVIYYPAVKIKHLGSHSTGFTNALYLNQHFVSGIEYFKKQKGKVYAGFFSFVCVICWIVLLIGLFPANLICRKERFTRKINMLSYVIKERFSKKYVRK